MSVYEERVSSRRTEVLFVGLTLLFLALSWWRVAAAGLGWLSVILLCAFLFFLFYSLNYRVLIIRLTTTALVLRFGIFAWTLRFDNMEACYLDDTSLWRIGGAGIHFTWLKGRYRAMFNFLEYPRVVVALKKKKGPVWDVAFSTKHAVEVKRMLEEAMLEGGVLSPGDWG
jgi:hypothetical protein